MQVRSRSRHSSDWRADLGPITTATVSHHCGPLKGINRDEGAERVDIARGDKRRRLHKAFLSHHNPNHTGLPTMDGLKRRWVVSSVCG